MKFKFKNLFGKTKVINAEILKISSQTTFKLKRSFFLLKNISNLSKKDHPNPTNQIHTVAQIISSVLNKFDTFPLEVPFSSQTQKFFSFYKKSEFHKSQECYLLGIQFPGRDKIWEGKTVFMWFYLIFFMVNFFLLSFLSFFYFMILFISHCSGKRFLITKHKCIKIRGPDNKVN